MLQTFKTAAKYGVVLSTVAIGNAFAALPASVQTDLDAGKVDVGTICAGFLLMAIVVGIFRMFRKA